LLTTTASELGATAWQNEKHSSSPLTQTAPAFGRSSDFLAFAHASGRATGILRRSPAGLRFRRLFRLDAPAPRLKVRRRPFVARRIDCVVRVLEDEVDSELAALG